ncbi:DUF1707 domain-containing protein [Cutibacterium sp. WCA-380-WT-3A]|uniref:DUF1707 domain-containing protein n=1 Tax=Cutibacterium porci TaxID=2605781 RepID=A0A7K0J5P6_9ACTN|nr:DUF1707 domain-containing protein [Cutibacterium porci]MSS45270.1 DUF1707 domain-containing protein [Cutibacterium porci]
MNTVPDNSSLRVTDEQRNRVLDHINDAYAHGVIDDIERERRTETALLARTRSELDESYRNLPSFKPSVPEGIRTPLPDVPEKRPTTGVGWCGLSALVSGPIGPAIGFAMTSKGSWARRKTTRQLVTQTAFFAVQMGLEPGPIGLHNSWGSSVVALIWMVVTIVQAVRGFQGRD